MYILDWRSSLGCGSEVKVGNKPVPWVWAGLKVPILKFYALPCFHAEEEAVVVAAVAAVAQADVSPDKSAGALCIGESFQLLLSRWQLLESQ